MTENNEKKHAMWLETDIEPLREFENEEFKRLIKYANENQKNLMRLLYNEHSDELRLGCKFGNSKLHFFENAISKDEKLLTIFKLGELYGHIECLGMIEYESLNDNHALSRFQMLTNRLPELKTETKEVIKILDRIGNMNEAELHKIVPVKLVDLRLILHILFINGLIHQSDRGVYSLSDIGLRVAKQMNNE